MHSNISLVMHRNMSGSHYIKELFMDINSEGQPVSSQFDHYLINITT